MRKISSHYCLKSDGTWIKRPVIELDDCGSILAVRELGDDFAEEPGLEYFPGIIVPAFIMVVNKELIDKESSARCIINGVRRFISDQPIDLQKAVRLEVVSVINSYSEQIPWLQILKADSIDLAREINRYTYELACQYGFGERWGAIRVGCNPGLLLLQGVDMRTFVLTNKVTIKVLVE